MSAPGARPGPPDAADAPAIENTRSAERLAALHARCFVAPWTPTAFARLIALPGTVALVAEAQGEPVGFVLARLAGEDCEVLTIGVVPSARGRGHGARLLDAVAAWAIVAGAARQVLEVGADNEAALALYGRAGFRRCGHRPGYYPARPDPARPDEDAAARGDALILERLLGPAGGGAD